MSGFLRKATNNMKKKTSTDLVVHGRKSGCELTVFIKVKSDCLSVNRMCVSRLMGTVRKDFHAFLLSLLLAPPLPLPLRPPPPAYAAINATLLPSLSFFLFSVSGSVVDLGCLSRLPDQDFPIPDSG